MRSLLCDAEDDLRRDTVESHDRQEETDGSQRGQQHDHGASERKARAQPLLERSRVIHRYGRVGLMHGGPNDRFRRDRRTDEDCRRGEEWNLSERIIDRRTRTILEGIRRGIKGPPDRTGTSSMEGARRLARRDPSSTPACPSRGVRSCATGISHRSASCPPA
jgi:hypothetical protein